MFLNCLLNEFAICFVVVVLNLIVLLFVSVWFVRETIIVFQSMYVWAVSVIPMRL